MNLAAFRFSLVGGLMLCIVAVGCSGGKGGATGTVSGTVTIDGTPLKQGTVTFHDESGEKGTAEIDDTGKFTLKNAIPVGKYTVTVSPAATPSGINPDDQNKMKQWMEMIPVAYQDVKKSDIVVEITAGENAAVEVQMKKGGGK